MADFEEIKSEATQLKSDHAGRVEMYNAMEQMYFMDWAEREKVERQADNVKLTVSPDARNMLLGAVRLMVATDPIIKVPFDRSQPGREVSSGKVEKFASKMLAASGKVSGSPLHYDLVLSALLYGEAHVAILPTQALAEYHKGKGNAYRARLERSARRTPYLFEVWNPRNCYARVDRHGLAAHLREVITTARAVQSDWGDRATAAMGGKRGNDSVTLHEWWDLEDHVVWVGDGKAPILNEAHGLPFIPIVFSASEGSTSLFSKAEQQRQPFLYTLWKSGLWNRQNLALSVLYTLVFGIGANPMFVYQRDDPNKTLQLDFSQPGGVAYIDRGEQFGPMAKNVIDPSLAAALDIADQKLTESTIYKQALGQPLGGNAPYSMVALLSQSGRLPLISPQRRLGWMLAQAIEIAFSWMQFDKIPGRAQYGGVAEIKAEDIPDDLEIECALDIALPQDRLQMANVANLVVGSGLTSREWARQEVLNIGQSDDMSRQILTERMGDALQGQMMQQLMAQQQQQQMQAAQGGMQQPGGQPPMQPPQGGQPPTSPELQGLPPEMLGLEGPMPPPGQEGYA